MPRQTKNIITRESCHAKLRHMAKATLLQDLVTCAVPLLLLVPLLLVTIMLVEDSLAKGLICLAQFLFIYSFFIHILVGDILRMRLIKRGEFSIVKDTVKYLSEDERPRNYTEGRNSVDVIYFTRHARYVATGFPFDFSSVGDEFYLVILHTKRKTPILAYHCDLYEYQEPDAVSG